MYDFQSRICNPTAMDFKFIITFTANYTCMRRLYSAAIVLMATFFVSTLKAQEVSEKSVQDLIKSNAAQLHISQADADNAAISSFFTDAGTGLLYTYVQ